MDGMIWDDIIRDGMEHIIEYTSIQFTYYLNRFDPDRPRYISPRGR